MKNFYKKACVIRDKNGVPLFFLDLVDFIDQSQYDALKKQANDNLTKRIEEYETHQQNFERSMNEKYNAFVTEVKSHINVLAEATRESLKK